MKVGDLVMLSAYAKGLKNHYNERHEDVALIVSVRWGSLFNVRWCSDNKLQINMDRKDLKYVNKASKKR